MAPRAASPAPSRQLHRSCRDPAAGSDYLMKADPSRAADGPMRRRSQGHEIHVDAEHPARRLHPVHELAEGDPRGERRLHDRVQQEAERRGRAGGCGRIGVAPAGEARARRQGRQADHRRRVPRVQGVPRGLLDRGHRQSRARVSARRGRIHRARRRRRAALGRGARDHERAPGHQVTPSPPEPDLRLERLLRELTPQVLGTVVRRHRDFAACEDAVQEALIAAAAQWPRDGVPGNPRGWLIQVALRRMTDHVRSEIARRGREAVVAGETPAAVAPAPPELDCEPAIDPDDTLLLLFMCCHPALSPASAIALTLRAVGGLTTAEIAKAFLVPEATMAQRISRAKQSIKQSRVPFRLPDAGERASRLGSVLHVLYLVFSEGYTASSGTALQRTDLANEAIRLTRAVHGLLPGDGEVAGP